MTICPFCKEKVADKAVKCKHCGSVLKHYQKRLVLSATNKKLMGVCGGIGEFAGVDPTIIRVVVLLVMLLTGMVPGIIVYFILGAFVIPGGEDKSEQ